MRVAGRALLLLAAIATGLAGPSSAQAQTACALDLTAAEDNPSVEGFTAQAARNFTFNIQNTGSLSADGDVFVFNPPPGWFWSSSVPPVRLPAGASISFRLQVVYDGSRDAAATLTVQLANVQCSLGVGPPVDGTAAAPLVLELTNAPLPPAPGADGGSSLAWLVFAGIVVVAGVVGPVALMRRRVAVDAFCEEAERDVIAGRGTSFPVVIRNKAGKPVHVGLDVTDVKEGWSALVTLPEVELAAKESRTIYMMVRAPGEARAGDLCMAKLAVKPVGGSEKTVTTLSRVGAAPAAKGRKT